MIELKEANESFKAPTGLALLNNHMFVCDRELRIVFKFDVKSGQLLNRVRLAEGEPSSLSVSGDRLVLTDCIASNLYVFNVETLEQMRSVSLKSIDRIGGQFEHVVSEEGLIFLKNADEHLTLLDGNLSQRATFNDINAKVLNLAVIRQNVTSMLVIGCVNKQQQFKLYGYVV